VKSRIGWLVVALVGVLGAAGCTTVVAGQGQPAPTGAEPSGSPSPGASEEPTPEVKLLRGKVREAHRLAGVVQRPDVVFPRFAKGCSPTGTFYSLDSLTAFGGVFPDNTIPALREGGYLTGYAQCRQYGAGRSLIAAAFEMKDAEACKVAVRKLAAALREKGAKLFPIPGFPDSYAVEQANQKDYNDPKKKTNLVQRMVPQGSVLNYVWARSSDIRTGRNGAARLIISQLHKIKSFQVTPVDKLPELDDDPEGLRARHAPLEGNLIPENGGYDLPAYLALAEDPAFEEALLTRDGLTEYFFEGAVNKESGDRYVSRGIGLYKVRDEAAARDVVAQFTALDKRITQGIRIVTVDGIPGAFCFAKGDQFGQIDQRCFFSKGPITVQIDVTGATRKFTDSAELAKLAKAQYDRL